MEREELSENKEVILYESKPIIEAETDNSHQEEKIREFQPERRRSLRALALQLWRFIAITTAFAVLFVCVYLYLGGQERQFFDETTASDSDEDDLPVAAPPEDLGTDHMTPKKAVPLVIDESMTGIDISEELNSDYSLGALLEAAEGIKVVIIHSHNSEYVSESISVYDAGEALAQIFNSAGIDTYHSKQVHDADGSIGSYKRMNDTLKQIISDNPGVICVIDLHDSDSGLPLTFTLGTDPEYGWKENLKLAAAIYRDMEEIEGAFRFLPGGLGQNTGLLSVNVGIGGKSHDDETARGYIAAFAEAFMMICNKNAAAEQ